MHAPPWGVVNKLTNTRKISDSVINPTSRLSRTTGAVPIFFSAISAAASEMRVCGLIVATSRVIHLPTIIMVISLAHFPHITLVGNNCRYRWDCRCCSKQLSILIVRERPAVGQPGVVNFPDSFLYLPSLLYQEPPWAHPCEPVHGFA